MTETKVETLRCAIYTRVSTQMQAEDEIPIQGQVEECEKYAQSKGWQVVKVYSDSGFSGGTIDRPGFQDMYHAAKEKPRPFDIVLTWRSNRLFRDVEARLAYSRMFRSAGVRIVTMHEPEYEGATGRLAETIFGAIDEYYRSQTSEDTLRGMKLVARHGYSTGGRPPRGYRNDRQPTGRKKDNGDTEMRTIWVPDSDMAQSVLKAFQMYAEGKTLAEIAEATKITAAKNGLSTLLRNRAYLGMRIYNTTRRRSLQEKKHFREKNNPDDMVIVHHDHDAIVPEELFYRVQARIDQRRPKIGQRKTSPNNYILSGILWCKEHDVPYAGHTTGTAYYYACQLRKKLGKKSVNCLWLKKEEAETFVLNILKTKIFTRRLIREGLEHLQKENAKARQQDDTELSATKAKIADAELKVSRLIKAITSGVEASAVEGAINGFNQELQGLRIHLTELEKQRDRAMKIPAITDANVVDVMLKLQTMLETTDPKELKTILSHFIEKIEIDGKKATFYYTFTEPRNEIVLTTGDPEGI
jgi:site-specific DNA recombinase